MLRFLRLSHRCIGDTTNNHRASRQPSLKPHQHIPLGHDDVLLVPALDLRVAQRVEGNELIDDEERDELLAEIPKAIEESLEGIRRVTKIISAMKSFSHQGSEECEPCDLNSMIESTVTISTSAWKGVAEIEFDLDYELSHVNCRQGPMNQVILNLIVNAAHAIEERTCETGTRGTIKISTIDEGPWIEIRVADTGAGIPVSARDQIFDPFFTTKGVGKGTGQGLAITHDVVVNKHKGEIRFETALGEGTTFFVRIPTD